MSDHFKYIDLFAGCGGLSLGLEQAGFKLELAVEKSDMAAETFYHNLIEHIEDQASWKRFSAKETSVQEQASKKLIIKELEEVLKCEEVLQSLRELDIDLVAGGPPCQGFSLAGRRNPDDARNMLPWQFLEFVELIRPKMVLIENVSGIAQSFKKHNAESPIEQLKMALAEIDGGYVVQQLLLNAMHFGVPQHRPRVFLIALRKDLAKKLNIQASNAVWRSEYQFTDVADRPGLAPQPTHHKQDVLSVADAIKDLSCDWESSNKQSVYAQEMHEAETCIIPHPPTDVVMNHKLRSHAKHIQNRFRLYQYFRDQKISYKVLSIPKQDDLDHAEKRALILNEITGAEYPAIAPDKTVLAQNPSQLIDMIMELGTKKHSQRPLDWHAPSPTVVSLPDDYVHPSEPRTLSVRELARFQSFPDSFEFRAKETTGGLLRRVQVPQYTQVGNAVPPRLARAVGEKLIEILKQI